MVQEAINNHLCSEHFKGFLIGLHLSAHTEGGSGLEKIGWVKYWGSIENIENFSRLGRRKQQKNVLGGFGQRCIEYVYRVCHDIICKNHC